MPYNLRGSGNGPLSFNDLTIKVGIAPGGDGGTPQGISEQSSSVFNRPS